MKAPNTVDVADEMRRLFPDCHVDDHQLKFLIAVRDAARKGVGYGWMRQSIGIVWKLADPIGYIDDDRIVELNARENGSDEE